MNYFCDNNTGMLGQPDVCDNNTGMLGQPDV